MKKLLLCFFGALLLTSTVYAAPFTSPTIDGNMNDWNADEQRATNDIAPWGASDVKDVWVTWDDTYLYVGMAAAIDGNKLTCYLESDMDGATGAKDMAVTAYEYQGNNLTIAAAADFGADFSFETEGSSYHQIFKYNSGTDDFDELVNGTSTDGDATWNGDAGEKQGYEARIKWSTLYPSATNTVPEGCTVRLIANIHNNQGSGWYASDDIIPLQTSGGTYSSGAWTDVADYIEVLVDANNDGTPDSGANDDPPVGTGIVGYGQTVDLTFNQNVGSGATTAANYELFSVVDTTETSLGNPATAVVDGTDAALVHLSYSSAVMSVGNTYKIAYENIEDEAGVAGAGAGSLNFTAGTAQAITVTFNLDTTPDLAANAPYNIRGGVAPLDWGTDLNLPNNNAAIFFGDVVFPAGSAATVEYKYVGNGNWENVPANRTLELDDTQATMTVDDLWGSLGVLSGDKDVIFRIDMSSVPVGKVQVRGEHNLLSWDEVDATECLDNGLASNGDETADDGIYSAKISFTTGEESSFTYKFTNVLGADTYWDPSADNLKYTIDESSENIITKTWQNTEIVTAVSDSVWSIFK